jgi:hypothetical protein
LELSTDVFDFVVERLTVAGQFGLAYFQPKFICDQVAAACKCFNLPARLTKELAAEALANLYVEIEDEQDAEPAVWNSGPNRARPREVPEREHFEPRAIGSRLRTSHVLNS